MVKTIKSSMSQARKKMLEQIKNKEESEVKRKKTAKEKYKELRESIKILNQLLNLFQINSKKN